MAYVTVRENGMSGLLDMFSKKKKKKAKEKAKAKEKKAAEEIKKIEKEEKINAAIAAEGDPSKRGDSIGARVSSLASGPFGASVPDWAIYAGAGVAVLGIIIWSRK